MSQFVEECRKEWHRLQVPDAAANEMAADLEADLAEAQADGVSPEEVLGNGFFDARSFAASWASARGVVGPKPRLAETMRLRTWALVGSALLFLSAGAVGLVILVGRRAGSVSAAVALRHAVPRPVPGIFVGPHSFGFGGQAGPADALGWVLLVAGFLGLGVTVLLWRPWASHRHGPEYDHNVGLPSYL